MRGDAAILLSVWRLSSQSQDLPQKSDGQTRFLAGTGRKIYGKISEKHRLRISAGQRGKILSNKTKQKISEVMKGRVFSDATKRKMSKNNVGFKGRKHSKETKQKLRLSHINRLEQIHGQLFPGYNPVACGIIEEYGKKHGFNFQHAENGGEFHIKELGFWVDGYDAKKNVVIEYYENWHQTQLTKDNNRKLEIVDCLDCEFIELKAWDTTGN